MHDHEHTNGPHWGIAAAIAVVSALLLWSPWDSPSGQPPDGHRITEGTVIRVLSEEHVDRSAGTRTDRVQEIAVELASGRAVTMTNDLIPLEAGDRIYVGVSLPDTPDESFAVIDVHRAGGLVKLAVLFAVLVIAVARRKGVYALVGLAFSVSVIFSFMLPAILRGADATFAGFTAAAIIAAVTLYLSHGFSPTFRAAFAGIAASLCVSALLGAVIVSALRFTGFGDESVLYLNYETGSTLNLAGLLVAGVIIAAIGVLDDVAATQASTVLALARASGRRGWGLFRHAMEVGTDHIAAVVNTLALAYIGAALPLVLLLSVSNFPLPFTLGGEQVAEEIVRTLVSSIGLVLAVPLTTAVAVWLAPKS